MAVGDRKGTLTGNAASIPDPAVLSGSVSVAVGDLIVAICGQQTALTVVGCTDNLNNPYTAQNAGTDPGSPTARVYYSIATQAGTLTAINFDTTSSTNDWAGFGAVYTGPFSAIDVNIANGTADVTSPFTCPATGTLAQSVELVVCWGCANQSTVWAATSPLLLDGNANNSSNVKVALGSKLTAATTTTSPEFTAAANPTTAILGTMSFRVVASQTDGAITAQNATMAGAGVSSSTQTDGAITAQAATISGAGLSTSTGTGVLAAQAATIAGTGVAEYTGTGVLVAQAATIAGEGEASGEETISGEGALNAQAATTSGAGVGESFGTGAFDAQLAAILGAGLAQWAAMGILSASPASMTGEGEVSGVGSYIPVPIHPHTSAYCKQWYRLNGPGVYVE